MTEFDQLWAAVEAGPADQAPKLILADWLQERGDQPDLEAGLRYCAARGKWPLMKVNNAGLCLWQCGSTPGHYMLPTVLPKTIDQWIDRKFTLANRGRQVVWGWESMEPRTLVARVGAAVLAGVEQEVPWPSI
jgi:uncharacterized protein (TIGR02996 family)